MIEMQLTVDDLLAGAAMTFDLAVPRHILRPGESDEVKEGDPEKEMIVRLHPLTIGKFQLIMKAAKNDSGLIPLLMIKEALVQPALSLDQIKQLHLGLVNFLIGHIRQISGLTPKKSFDGPPASPLLQASYLLAREFGWTPEQVQQMTMAQVSLYLQMMENGNSARHDK